MGIGYIYDKHKSVDVTASVELVAKLMEEVGEFTEALENFMQQEYSTSYDCEIAAANVIEEGCDVCHVVETILRYCGISNEKLGNGQSFVHYKNQLRGYYDE